MAEPGSDSPDRSIADGPVARAGARTERLSKDAARQLTDEAKHHIAAAWRVLWRLYEGDAHTALGHASWHAYCKAEFGFSKSQSYRLRDAGRVAELVPQLGNEAHAREFVRLLHDHRDELEEVWSEATRRAEASNRRLTASQIRGVVNEVLDSARQPSVQAADLISPSPSARCARRLVEVSDELAGKLLDLEDSATRFDAVTSEGELGDAWSAHKGLLSLVQALASEGAPCSTRL